MDKNIQQRARSASSRVFGLKAARALLKAARGAGTLLFHISGVAPEVAFFVAVGALLGAGLAAEALFPSMATPLNAAWAHASHWWGAHPFASNAIALVSSVAILGLLFWRFEKPTALEARVHGELRLAQEALPSLAEARELELAAGPEPTAPRRKPQRL